MSSPVRRTRAPRHDPAVGVRVGARIRELRSAQGFTIESLAQELGYSWITVSRYERGVSTPSVDRLGQIAKVLGVKVTELLPESKAA